MDSLGAAGVQLVLLAQLGIQRFVGGKIGAEAAKTGGCQMGVAVDQTGHDHHAGTVDDGSRLLLGCDLGNGCDLAILDS